VLLEEYGVRLEVAMTAYRPVMRALEETRPAADGGAADGAAAANGGAAGGADGDAEMEEGEAAAPAAALAVAGGGAAAGPGGRTWAGLMEDVRAALPGVAGALSPELVAAFWGLSLVDVAFPAARCARGRGGRMERAGTCSTRGLIKVRRACTLETITTAAL
jgi:hypothetical protein